MAFDYRWDIRPFNNKRYLVVIRTDDVTQLDTVLTNLGWEPFDGRAATLVAIAGRLPSRAVAPKPVRNKLCCELFPIIYDPSDPPELYIPISAPPLPGGGAGLIAGTCLLEFGHPASTPHEWIDADDVVWRAGVGKVTDGTATVQRQQAGR